jgi:hypothetical protein
MRIWGPLSAALLRFWCENDFASTSRPKTPSWPCWRLRKGLSDLETQCTVEAQQEPVKRNRHNNVDFFWYGARGDIRSVAMAQPAQKRASGRHSHRECRLDGLRQTAPFRSATAIHIAAPAQARRSTHPLRLFHFRTVRRRRRGCGLVVNSLEFSTNPHPVRLNASSSRYYIGEHATRTRR